MCKISFEIISDIKINYSCYYSDGELIDADMERLSGLKYLAHGARFFFAFERRLKKQELNGEDIYTGQAAWCSVSVTEFDIEQASRSK